MNIEAENPIFVALGQSKITYWNLQDTFEMDLLERTGLLMGDPESPPEKVLRYLERRGIRRDEIVAQYGKWRGVFKKRCRLLLKEAKARAGIGLSVEEDD